MLHLSCSWDDIWVAARADWVDTTASLQPTSQHVSFVFSLSTLAADDGSQAQGGPSSGTLLNSAFVHAMKQLIGALDRILPNASQLQG